MTPFLHLVCSAARSARRGRAHGPVRPPSSPGTALDFQRYILPDYSRACSRSPGRCLSVRISAYVRARAWSGGERLGEVPDAQDAVEGPPDRLPAVAGESAADQRGVGNLVVVKLTA